jgi:hypothetical protein
VSKEDYLFDIECYTKGQVLWQVRQCSVEDPNDSGIILATFVHQEHCALMKQLVYDKEKWDLCIVEYTVGEGITDFFGLAEFCQYHHDMSIR